MIQPLPSHLSEWSLLWVELDDPVCDPAGKIILPTLILIFDARGVALGKPLVLPEIDQIKVENFLLHLFQEHGKPEGLSVARAEEWEEEDWKSFAGEQELRLRFVDLDEDGWAGMNTLPWAQKITKEPSLDAHGLLRTALLLRSPRRRASYLQRVIQLNGELLEAQIELADHDFGRGAWKEARERYQEIVRKGEKWEQLHEVLWWEDFKTRPYLRAIFGRAMVAWHEGKHREAARDFARLLEINPKDHQGARFFLPLVWLLADDLEEAAAFYQTYEKRYPGDFVDPAFYFGWGLVLFLGGDEARARRKYQEAMLRNVYLAPMLLEKPEPEGPMWLPNERAEPSYAAEFVDSYAPLWDRDAGTLRAVREAWQELSAQIADLISHRRLMLDYQDQRYEVDYRRKWEALVLEEQRLSETVLPPS